MKRGMMGLLLISSVVTGAASAATLTIGGEEYSSGEPLCVS